MEPGKSRRSAVDSLAESLLGLRLDQDHASKLAGLCVILRDEEFLPDPMLHEAILAIAGKPLGPESWLLQKAATENDLRLSDAVQLFAEEFFAIPIPPRIERWKGLMQACSGKPFLLRWLKALNPGLKIEAPNSDDPSPAVNQVINDLLALFPLRHGIRASEVRARAERFREDPRFTPSDRARAVKRTRRKHEMLASLLPGYFENLLKPRTIRPAWRWRDRTFKPILERLKRHPVLTVLGFCLCIAAIVILADEGHQSFGSRPLRRDFERGIRIGLAGRGKHLDDRQIDLLVGRLPIQELAKSGNFADIKSRGVWTEQVWLRFVRALKEGLHELDAGLRETELDTLSRASLPAPAPIWVRPRLPSP